LVPSDTSPNCHAIRRPVAIQIPDAQPNPLAIALQDADRGPVYTTADRNRIGFAISIPDGDRELDVRGDARPVACEVTGCDTVGIPESDTVPVACADPFPAARPDPFPIACADAFRAAGPDTVSTTRAHPAEITRPDAN
jgi:hypothetical protein